MTSKVVTTCDACGDVTERFGWHSLSFPRLDLDSPLNHIDKDYCDICWPIVEKVMIWSVNQMPDVVKYGNLQGKDFQ